jgi:hypothetical protein
MIVHRSRRWAAFWLMLSCAMLVGCDDRPKRVGVSGRVTIDGEPLTTGVIYFAPEGTRPSMGNIGEDGSFTMTCYGDNDGVIPGTHRVSIAAMEVLGPSKIKWFAPPKYADFNTSGLTVTIDKKTEEQNFELTWDGGKPFIQKSKRETFTEQSDDI